MKLKHLPDEDSCPHCNAPIHSVDITSFTKIGSSDRNETQFYDCDFSRHYYSSDKGIHIGKPCPKTKDGKARAALEVEIQRRIDFVFSDLSPEIGSEKDRIGAIAKIKDAAKSFFRWGS